MKYKLFPKTIIHILIGIFVVLIAYFFVPQISQTVGRQFFLLMAALGLIFLILGIVLLVQAKKQTGKLKKFLILTGWSAIAPFAFSILHNLFYALAIIASANALKMFFEFLHATCFIISLIVAPLGFLVGVIGSLILLRKK